MSSGLQATILARAGLLDRPAWPAQRRGVAQRHLPLRRHPRQLHRAAPAPRRRPLPRLLLPDGRRGDATVGKLATVCAEHLHQGRGIRAVGRIKQERWEDPDGNARSKVLIVAEHVEFPPLRTPQREREMAAAAS